MYSVVRTELAESDFASILEYLEEHSQSAADRFTTDVVKTCRHLQDSPKMGRARDELTAGIRSIAIQKYVLFYRINDNTVEIVRILHGARDIPALFELD